MRTAASTLVGEHEVTRLVTLVTRIAQRMGIDEADDPELAELGRDVAPERVLDQLANNRREARG